MAKNTLKDLVQQVLRDQIGTRNFTPGALAAGTAPGKVKTVTALNYCINNVLYTKAATDDFFVHTDLTVQAADTTKYYLLCVDTTGAASIVAGTATDLPDVPAGTCAVGYLKIVTVAVTFTPATTSHAAAGVTTTYVNLSQLPLLLA